MPIERKRTEWIDRDIDVETSTVTFTGMRQTATMDKPVVMWTEILTWTKCAPETCAYATGHGFAARLGDKTALPAGATMDERKAAIVEMRDYYETGATEWALRGTRAKADPTAMLAKLLANDPAKLAEIIAAAEALRDAALANREG